MKNIRSILLVLVFLFLMSNFLYAKDITIVYSGQTHAMLYTCSCPIERDGGIARRASLIKELRKSDPNLLLLDCGSFSAGGLLDEYTQSAKLDMQRTLVNFKALELMRYDAVGISSDEFNFGKEFFLKISRTANPAFLSANLESRQVIPYVIKDLKGIKVGLVGLTGLAVSQKSEGIKISEPKKISELISRLKQEGAQVIVLLSTLGEKEDLKLISEVKGIDILFVGQNPLKDEPLTKVDSTFILRPLWQGRKIGKLTLKIKDGQLTDCKTEEIKVSERFTDDPQILSILPRCYSDANCKKEGFAGNCANPGDLSAQCVFTRPNEISLRVITVKDCIVCNEEPVINLLKKKFPGIVVKYLYYPDLAVQELIKGLPVESLPVYLLGQEIEKEDNFYSIKDDFILVKDSYLLKPQLSGLAYFFKRNKNEGSLDLFFSIFEKDADKLLSATEDLKPNLHFLIVEDAQGFTAKHGALEVEECLRGACVQKYYPKVFWNYLTCRSKKIDSSYWDDCLNAAQLPEIRTCARGPEGIKLLKENISLSKELQIMFGPTYLLNNQEIFSLRDVPKKEELKKIIKR
ncbi:MAG: hypothetical protein WCY09_02750 [Candidatus Omnitrophota bacterium]